LDAGLLAIGGELLKHSLQREFADAVLRDAEVGFVRFKDRKQIGQSE